MLTATNKKDFYVKYSFIKHRVCEDEKKTDILEKSFSSLKIRTKRIMSFN